MTVDPVIVLIARLGLTWLFLDAVAHKLRDVRGFGAVLATYRVLPDVLVPAAVWLVIAAELFIGVGALLQFAPAIALGAIVLLGYAAVMAANLWRGRRFIDCGCGGAAQPLSVALVVRNLLLACGALVAVLPVVARPLGWLDLVTVIVATVVLATVYAAANQLLAARARLEEWV